MSTFSVFSLDVLLLIYLSKKNDNASAEPMTDPGGGGGLLWNNYECFENNVMITSTSIFVQFNIRLMIALSR